MGSAGHGSRKSVKENRGRAQRMPTVFALHTTFATVDLLRGIFAEIMPDVRIVNVADDSLLADVRIAGGVTPSVTRRLIGYGVLAQASGADAIFNCCSSVGEAADLLARSVDIPVVKIDDAMASEAVQAAGRIAVMATVATTLGPTERLLHAKASQAGKKIETKTYLVEGAFDALMGGQKELHDSLVLAAIESAARENDAVVLAQGSMARLVPALSGRVNVPVFSSPRSGIEALKRALELRAKSVAAGAASE